MGQTEEDEKDKQESVSYFFLLFFPEGYIAAFIALCCPVIAGRLVFGGFLAEGAIILVVAFALTIGAIFSLARRAKFLAWLCMMGLITTVFLVNEHLPSPNKIFGGAELRLSFRVLS